MCALRAATNIDKLTKKNYYTRRGAHTHNFSPLQTLHALAYIIRINRTNTKYLLARGSPPPVLWANVCCSICVFVCGAHKMCVRVCIGLLFRLASYSIMWSACETLNLTVSQSCGSALCLPTQNSRVGDERLKFPIFKLFIFFFSFIRIS